MIIFNSFTFSNDYNFGAQRPNGRRILLPTNKTFDGICLALSGKSLQSLFTLHKLADKVVLDR